MLALLVSPFVASVAGFFFNHSPAIVPSRAAADHQVYDWLILLDREIEDIWRSKSNVSKILFILTRYAPFLDMPITITSESDTVHVDLWCGGNADLSSAAL